MYTYIFLRKLKIKNKIWKPLKTIGSLKIFATFVLWQIRVVHLQA